MSYFSLLKVEQIKLRRSHIVWILLIPVTLPWVMNVLNAGIHLSSQTISPENNFFLQSFMGFVWLLYPATLMVSTVLLTQMEQNNRGLLKMLSLPLSPVKLCLAKFTVLLLLAALQFLLMDLLYFPSAWLASQMNGYQFMLSPLLVFQQSGMMFLTSLPMAALYWMIATLLSSPVFSVGIGLASIVPSVLILNTKIWYCYPPCYSFYWLTQLMGQMSDPSGQFQFQWIPFLPVAVGLLAVFLVVSCLCFGRTERRSFS